METKKIKELLNELDVSVSADDIQTQQDVNDIKDYLDDSDDDDSVVITNESEEELIGEAMRLDYSSMLSDMGINRGDLNDMEWFKLKKDLFKFLKYIRSEYNVGIDFRDPQMNLDSNYQMESFSSIIDGELKKHLQEIKHKTKPKMTKNEIINYLKNKK